MKFFTTKVCQIDRTKITNGIGINPISYEDRIIKIHLTSSGDVSSVTATELEQVIMEKLKEINLIRSK